MSYQMLVKNVFNDMYIFFNGTQPLGLEALLDAYGEEPLFLAFISNLEEAVNVSYNDAMQECYAFYKAYCGRMLTDEEWEQVIAEIGEYYKRWNNRWCEGLILAVLGLLEMENKELDGKAPREEKPEEEDVYQEEETQQEMEQAA